jgi:AraC family transcriptional regulator
MKLYIKNMVCPRCITAVEGILKTIKASSVFVHLGEVLLDKPLSVKQSTELEIRLKNIGFELLDDNRKQQIEKIKATIIGHVQHKPNEKFSFADELSKELHKEYSYLSKLFSETEGITIEHFVILQKIEKAKELLAYNQMNLNEISFSLGYSSVAHLSAQFKKMTGLTPSQFKAQGIHLRKPLDGV